jgi:hypothetical protein
LVLKFKDLAQQWDGEPMVGFEQGRDMVWLEFIKDSYCFCVENSLWGKEGKDRSRETT